MSAPDLNELAAKVEAAEGPSRELDAAIWYAAVEKPRTGDKLDKDIIGKWPSYTSSLDAALSLMPERWAWSITYERERELSSKPPFFADVRRSYRTSYDAVLMAWAETPALALCAAALRAAALAKAEQRA